MTEAAASLRSVFVKIGAAYCLLIVYASTVIGPSGIHFVPIDIDTAWREFLATGRDPALVRSDWTSNLLMFVPLGFISAGASWPERPGLRRGVAAIAALAFCLSFLLAVKFAQLYFPPRTVTLDYILAQSLGALIGIVLFVASRRPLVLVRGLLARRGRAALTVALAAYGSALFAFFLFPFDFVVTGGELYHRIGQLQLLALPGSAAPLPWPLVAPLVEIVETIPLGILIGLHWRERRVLVAGIAGFLGMSGICLLQILVLSATPHIASVLFHTAGIVGGAFAVGSLEQLTLIRWRLNLARAVPALALAYLIGVLATKNLIALDWRTPADAWAALDPRGLLPFWDSYIVSKSHAAFSTLAHVLLYAPIGVMVWLRRGSRPGGGMAAATLAVILSSAVEIGRWLRPDFQPDFTNVLIAAIAAPLAIPFSAWIWGVLQASFPTPGLPSLRPAPNLLRGTLPSPPVPRRGSGSLAALRWLPISAGCAALIIAALMRYPLSPWPLGLGLGVYAACLFRWPILWLAIVPAALPALDLALWTGWLYVGESDLLILATVAVLLLRSPPVFADLRLPRFAVGALLLSSLVYVLSLAIGLWLAPAAPTANPYLSAWNGARLAKGFAEALILLPFLGQAIRSRGDAPVWLGAGMIGGLMLVSIAAIVERAAFVGIFDFAAGYRVVATFSSMHVGGGHLGTYLATAIPFLALLLLWPRWGIPLGLALSAIAGYALVVTFARTGYSAAIIATTVVSVGWAIAGRRSSRRPSAAAAPLLGGLGLAIGLGAMAASSSFMHERLEQSDTDLTTRENNWGRGLAARDPGAPTWLFGMGLGTYPRVYRSRADGHPAPSNYQVGHDAGRSWIEIEPGDSTFYFGQKVPVDEAGDYRLSADLRLPSKSIPLGVLLCEKMLLYSDDCTSASLATTEPGQWVHATATLPVKRLAPPILFGLVRRPVELAFHLPSGASAAVTAVRLIGPQQQDLVRNGDFGDATDGWYFTDDTHPAWRIFNQFLMLLFEQGIVGVIAHILLTGAALFALWRAIFAGDRAAAPLAGGITGFFCAGLFEAPLEAPRLAAVYFILCCAGLLLAPAVPSRPPAASR